MSRQASSTVRDESAPRFKLRTLLFPLSLIVLAIGFGGVGQALNLFRELGFGAQVTTALAFAVAAVGLSSFVILALWAGKDKVGGLLHELAPLPAVGENLSQAQRSDRIGRRRSFEERFGSGEWSQRQAWLGMGLNALAIASASGMCVTTILGVTSPLAWLLTNIVVTSGSNLIGFSISTVISERIRLLAEQYHQIKIVEKTAELGRLAGELSKQESILRSEQSHKLLLIRQMEALVKQLRDSGIEPAISVEAIPLLELGGAAVVAAGTGLAAASPTDVEPAADEFSRGSPLTAHGLYRRPSRVAAEPYATAAGVVATSVAPGSA